MRNALSIFLIIQLLLSCEKPLTAPLSSFKGTWKGTYSGTNTGRQDNGTINIIITSTGEATGTATSAVFIQTFDIKGTVVSNGQITMTGGAVNSGATFNGSLSGTKGTGTWSNKSGVDNYTGNWTVTKQ